jgi:ribosomal protein S27E
MYQPVQITKCEKCGKTIAEPNVLIRVTEGKIEYWRENL